MTEAATQSIVRRCRRTWRRIGVPREAAVDMAAELSSDLEAARLDGRDPYSYVGGDPAGFARAWASERGVVSLRPLTGRLTVAAALGGLPAGFVGLFAAFGLDSASTANVLGRTTPLEPPTWLILVFYIVSGVFAWAGMLLAASEVLRFHADAARRATVRTLAWALPLAGAGAAVVTAGAAGYLGHPFGVRYVIAEAVVPVVIVLTVVAGVRWDVVRRRRAAGGLRTTSNTALVAPDL
ncbi:hypothetical protein ACSNOI_05200 [Actinomadura kijaniata]|uniref:hypothetical protein n=1 Tax=Actinomadura kijaniata TaxID=46161 RepID=UPI003F1CEBE1